MTSQDLPCVSVLFDRPPPVQEGSGASGPPSFFRDLHLDQVVRAILVGREEYELAPFFHSPLENTRAVRYRQEVMRDLEKPRLTSMVRSFVERMARARSYLRGMGRVEGRHYKHGWFLDSAERYCAAVTGLLDDLEDTPVGSQAMTRLRAYLRDYVASREFVSLASQVRQLRADLAEVQYCLLIKGTKVTVDAYNGEADYSAEIMGTFARFRQGEVKDFRKEFRAQRDANHVQAQVLDRVSTLCPETFARMEACYVRHPDFIDATVATFYREVQFYLAYLEFAQRLKDSNLPFCYPDVSEHTKQAHLEGAFDIALANVLVAKGASVVTNDVELREGERILVVTGPNQGGKTTLARMFGQMHYLAALGLPVPGRHAQLFLPDQIFTHFEREERLDSLRGKLDDELIRARDILADATSQSIVIINEGFAATTLSDSLFIGTRVLEQISELGALCVYVTFVDELALLNGATVSVVADVVPDDPEVRTFKLTRRPADGRAYALALARKYGLTYAHLRQRVAS